MLRRFVLPTSRFALRPAIGNPVTWDRQCLQVNNPSLDHLRKLRHHLSPVPMVQCQSVSR
jgi:hypothetical protein